MPDQVLEQAKADMQKAFDHTAHEFNALHTGKASPAMVEGVMVDAYDSQMRLMEVAAITTPDARTIRIQPWDKGVIKAVEKAIQAANVGLNPVVDGDIVRCPIPELSKDRRKELVKVAHGHAEQGRVGIRGGRRDAMDKLKAMQKESAITEDDLKLYEKDVQKLTDDFVGKINDALKAKEDELMKV